MACGTRGLLGGLSTNSGDRGATLALHLKRNHNVGRSRTQQLGLRTSNFRRQICHSKLLL
jgi:hypothetical protein